jgi:hypothetical protein
MLAREPTESIIPRHDSKRTSLSANSAENQIFLARED